MDEAPMYVATMDAIVSRWFTTYAEARASLDAEGGYLLPYRTQFLVTAREGVRRVSGVRLLVFLACQELSYPAQPDRPGLPC
jgi:hypothetical protein